MCNKKGAIDVRIYPIQHPHIKHVELRLHSLKIMGYVEKDSIWQLTIGLTNPLEHVIFNEHLLKSMINDICCQKSNISKNMQKPHILKIVFQITIPLLNKIHYKYPQFCFDQNQRLRKFSLPFINTFWSKTQSILFK